MGYKLYASMGTGDFYMEHKIDVSTSFRTFPFSFILCYNILQFTNGMGSENNFRNKYFFGAFERKQIFLIYPISFVILFWVPANSHQQYRT